MSTSQTTVRFEEPGKFPINQLSIINQFKSTEKKYCLLYMNFENVGIHTFYVYLNFL